MKSETKFIPEGFHALTPYLTVKDAAAAIEFYKRAFGARERMRMPMPDGKVGHAELQIADSIFMLGEECPEHGSVSPQTLEGSPVSLALYVQNVDEMFNRAVSAGATVKEQVENKFWGDRTGSITDPFGHKWMLLTHVEDVSPQEMKSRMEKAFSMASANK
ncbi:MAG TPA: VOC family protein [Verrucomicrobiae bacterium]|nr:VOC family protein [Verrucomicrobiae bacterium]